MNKSLELVAGIVLIIIGFLAQLYGVFIILRGNLNGGLAIFILGFVLYFLGRNLNDLRSFVVKILIHAGILFLSLGLVFSVMHANSSDIAHSIQPSIDFMLASAVDDLVEEYADSIEEREFTLLLADEVDSTTVYVRNITTSQIEMITSEFELDNKPAADQEFFAKFLINTIYTELVKQPQGTDVAVPLDLIAEEYGDALGDISGIDSEYLALLCEPDTQDLEVLIQNLKLLQPQTFADVSVELVTSFCSENPHAFVNFLLLEGEIIKTVNTKSLSAEDAELIWKNLGFEREISSRSKQIILSSGLGFLGQEIDTYGLDSSDPLPVASISSAIPADIIYLFSYDIFSEDLYERQQVIDSARGDCKAGKIEINEICDAILLTEYDTLFANLDNLEEEIELPINVQPFLEEIDSIDKIENKLDESTKYWYLFILFSCVFFIIVFILKIMMESRAGNVSALFDTGLFFSREFFLGFAPYALIVAIIFIGFEYGTRLLVDIVSPSFPTEAQSILQSLFEIPLFYLVLLVLVNVLRLHFYFFIVSGVALGIFLIYKYSPQKQKTAEIE